ncbi:hypothetical protein P7M46_07425 [Bisgaard Taxon 10/6]|uniref:hypothetical protein n=1 Tax=Exercitatus varius TaxID=67857 RepID=UPI00294AC27D|nr:hypothetical protein [Exercitatus varius]MDG2917834.1 hypothetical protein [Exercitatus varius]
MNILFPLACIILPVFIFLFISTVLKYELYYIFVILLLIFVLFIFREVKKYKKQQEIFKQEREAMEKEIQRQTYLNMVNQSLVKGKATFIDKNGNKQDLDIAVNLKIK